MILLMIGSLPLTGGSSLYTKRLPRKGQSVIFSVDLML